MPELIHEMRKFNYLTSEINAEYHKISTKLGISDSVSQILYTCCCHEICLIRDICRLTGISKQTINSSLRKLENDGLIVVKPFKGRQKQVILTEKGKLFADKTVMKIIDIENHVFEGWTEQEKTQYIALTQKYLDTFRAEVESVGDAE